MKNTATEDEYFTPLEDNDSLEIPESVTGDQQPILLNTPALALKPMRFLSRAATGLFTLLMVFVIWQSVQFFNFLWNFHWTLGTIFAVLILGLLGTVGRVILDFYRYQQDFREIDQLQESARALQESRSTGQGKRWISRLKLLYQGKPQREMLEQALTDMPDYADDSETIRHIDQQLCQALDQQAITVVSKHSQQTALMVALSPVAIVDMLLSAWRCLRMIDEICQIYGLRPSFPARMKLLKMTFNQMALAGATELLSGQLADFASNKLLGTISAQAASGLGVGLYSARIGFQVIRICRPIPFLPEQEPRISLVAKALYATIKAQFQRKE